MGICMVLGITGGIGTGKSTVLKLLKEKYHFHVFEADCVAHELMLPGNDIYKNIVECFGTGFLNSDGSIDRTKFGAIIFSDAEKLEKIDNIVHPAVIVELSRRIEQIKNKDSKADFVIEAALLIESGCYKICDRLWYVYSDTKTRSDRLKKYRGYSDEKIEHVIANQLAEDEFLKYADDVIDNSFSIDETAVQIEKKLVLLGKVC